MENKYEKIDFIYEGNTDSDLGMNDIDFYSFVESGCKKAFECN